MKPVALSARYKCKNTGRFVAIVDDEDFEYVSRFAWMAQVQIDREGVEYVRARRTDRTTGRTTVVDMHRSIWERANGPVPEGMTIDHVDHGAHGALDNRRSNLRLASKHDQQGNRRKCVTSKSKWKGVTRAATKSIRWTVSINNYGRTVNLGTFLDEQEAARAYDVWARSHFGAFARLNFPESAA